MDPCAEHSLMCKQVVETKDNTQKIITGLYGSLDNSSKGFIHEVREELIAIKNALVSVKNMRGVIVRSAVYIIVTILTAAASVVVAMVK